MTATLTFADRDAALAFAKAYSRHTLRGYSIAGTEVRVDGLSSGDIEWIDAYVSRVNELANNT